MGAQHQNLIGPQVRRLRVAMSWTQEDLAAACQRAGWDVPRSGIGKIESRLRCVTDFELIHLAKVFKCRVGDLFGVEQDQCRN
jgi:DNA-binding XRE family transcriptional regulator